MTLNLSLVCEWLICAHSIWPVSHENLKKRKDSHLLLNLVCRLSSENFAEEHVCEGISHMSINNQKSMNVMSWEGSTKPSLQKLKWVIIWDPAVETLLKTVS